MTEVLLTAAELAAALHSDRPPVLLDVRWQLGGPPGHRDYLAGHVPGAVYADLDTELAGGGEPADGRHPLPSPEAFQSAARRWGVTADRPVVAYDATGNQAAARAWWLLRWAGHPDVRLLDGGLSAWQRHGGELARDDVAPAPGDFTVRPGSLPTLTRDELGPYHGVLLDARAAERYRGETEPVDPKAGHIPGAVSVPTAGNLADDETFLPAAQLRARFAAAGADGSAPIGVYCGSGVTAAHEIAALAIAGLDAALYPGSWSQWSNLDLPVATGAEPGRG